MEFSQEEEKIKNDFAAVEYIFLPFIWVLDCCERP